MSIEIFRDELIAGVSDGLRKLNEYRLATEDWKAVSRLAEEKYKSWEWTFGQSPTFTAHHKFQLGKNKILYNDLAVCNIFRHGMKALN
ncbi:MAG: hypothetical protein KJO34_05660, partial [Deltaproteobacteria bacterium]|nr:hypothetical protein [Deltaproteobacteria bacterium]